MNQSHISCRDDYEISCDDLDNLVEILLKNGAKGARLTGAGFGGCAISVVEKDKADSLIDSVWTEYYHKYLKKQSIKTPKDKNSVIFSCIPSSGASVI
ncbi:MAG: hypothetical protein SNJ70_02330 [Armatimonadota bacterium]